MPAWNFPYLGETEDLTDDVRAAAPGRFIRLPDGCTHYELGGPPDGRTVVLVHGFSVPYFIWEPTFAALTQAGFRVLRYDLFGRGYSDRPRVDYDIHLFYRQLLDLLDALGFTDPVSLFGLSMGGPIATTFTVRSPERVKQLILIDPAGARPLRPSLTGSLLRLPGLGELLLGLFGNAALLKSMAQDFYDPRLVETFLEKYRPQMQYRGFKRAILSTLRNDMLGDFSDTYRRIGQQDVPILLIWGANDQTVPYAHSQSMLKTIPRIEFHTIKDAGHIPHYERADVVNPLLIEFLSEK